MHSAAIALLIWFAHSDCGFDLLDRDLTGTCRHGTLGALEVQVAQVVPGPPGITVAEGETTLHLSWNPNPINTDGYLVFRDNANTPITRVNGRESTKWIYALSELGLKYGDPICFRLKAFNANGESAFTDGVCAEW